MVSKPYTERQGDHPRRSSSFLFLFAIGALVAGAGAAGLHYSKPYFGESHVSSEQNATTEATPEHVIQEHAATMPVEPVSLTAADITAAPAAHADAGVAPSSIATPVAEAQKSKTPAPRPVARPRRPTINPADTRPSSEATKPSEDVFAKPE